MSLLPHHSRKLKIIALIFLVSWIIGTFAVHYFERGHPIGQSYFNAFYFTVITTATIWFWDLVPLTVGWKIVTMMYAIFYVPLFLYVMTLIYQNNIERLRSKDREHDMLLDAIRADMHEVESDVGAIIDNKNANHTSPRKRIAKR